MQLKKELLNMVVKTPTTCWENGKYEIENEEANIVSGNVCAVRQTKRKRQPFVVDVKFAAHV